MILPPFPTDDATLDLLHLALNPGPDADRTSLGDLCRLYSEMGGSDLTAVEPGDVDDRVQVMRDPEYHHNDVITALVAEVRRLRGESR